MNKKAMLFTLVILIAFLVLFSFVNRLAFLSAQQDHVMIAQEELIHLYGLQQNLASTYSTYLGLGDVIFYSNTTHVSTTVNGNITAQETSSFLSDLYTFYTTKFKQKTTGFELTSPLTDVLFFSPHGYNVSIDTNEFLFQWDEITTVETLSITLFLNTSITSVDNSQTSDSSSNPLINISIYDENGFYDNYDDTLNVTQDNGNISFNANNVTYVVSFGNYMGDDGVLRVSKNNTVSDMDIQQLVILSQSDQSASIEGFAVEYKSEHLSYDGNIKLAYE